jgi:uncharacterized membrane protein YfcA
MADSFLYVAAGLVVGLLIGITGVGGGSIMTPILVFGFGQSPSVAVGTDLVFSATTKLAATGSLGYSHRIDWRIVGRFALGSLPAAAIVTTWLYLAHRPPVEVDRFVLRSLAPARSCFSSGSSSNSGCERPPRRSAVRSGCSPR